jgi:alkylation response protein AidB-like acyl-CoA dehydrogenase
MTRSAEHSTMLRDSVAGFVGRNADVGRARKLRGTPAEYDRGVWRQMAQLGWLGILVPERYGGLGLGLVDAAVVAEGLARSLAPEPYTATAVLAVRALDAAGSDALKNLLLPRIASGALMAALAWQERAGVLDANAVETVAIPFEGGYRVNGVKRFIAGAAGADGYLVTARTAQGVGLLWVPCDAPGLNLELEPLADGRHFGALSMRDVAVPREHAAVSPAAPPAALAGALDDATVIISAELNGVMDRALEMSLDYMRTRVQFGKPIGSFQALQHRAVDLHIQRELASAVLGEVLRVLDEHPDSHTRARMASRAKARCSDAGSKIARESIQLHGAIGFTDELDAGLYLKRTLVLSAWLGSAAYHRRRYAALTA